MGSYFDAISSGVYHFASGAAYYATTAITSTTGLVVYAATSVYSSLPSLTSTTSAVQETAAHVTAVVHSTFSSIGTSDAKDEPPVSMAATAGIAGAKRHKHDNDPWEIIEHEDVPLPQKVDKIDETPEIKDTEMMAPSVVYSCKEIGKPLNLLVHKEFPYNRYFICKIEKNEDDRLIGFKKPGPFLHVRVYTAKKIGSKYFIDNNLKDFKENVELPLDELDSWPKYYDSGYDSKPLAVKPEVIKKLI